MRATLAPILAAGLLIAAAGPAAAERYLVVLHSPSAQPGHAAALVEGHGGQLVRDLHRLGVALADSDDPGFAGRVASDHRVLGVRRELLRQADFGFTHPEAVGAPPEELGGTAPLAGAGPAAIAPPFVPPERLTRTFFYRNGFHWDMTQARFEDAWALGFAGAPATKVAVLASGIDYTHVELVGRVDLDLSRNFVPEDAAMVEALYPGAHPIADLGLHGTYTASLIVCNARAQSCGIPNATLIGVKWLNFEEKGRVGDLVTAIDYAASLPADVIVVPDNLGLFHMSDPDDRVDIIALRRAVQRAEASGALILGAAWGVLFDCGFDVDGDGDAVLMPAQAGTTVVGVVGREEERWSGESSYGFSLVDVGAPGGHLDLATCTPPPDVNIFSLGSCSAFTRYTTPAGVDMSEVCNFETTPLWIFSFGVRPAVAHAASVAGMIEQRFAGRRGTWVRNQIFRTAEDVVTPGVDAFTGRGRVDALRAVTE